MSAIQSATFASLEQRYISHECVKKCTLHSLL
jgi:hypothetical protein